MNPTLPCPTRRAMLMTSVLGAALSACSSPSLAVGHHVGVDLIDRDTGQVLEVYQHRGRTYVAGRPGARYAIRISNRSAARILAVTAVDGVNVVSGQTAAWGQTGYVFAPWQTYELTGWRKSDQQVAAFEFTALPDSYAARTGRPLDVGVIGVAIFREKLRPPVVQMLPQARDERRADRMDSNAASPAAAAAPSQAPPASPPASPPAPSATGKASAEMQEAARSRLGTGHGEREDSRVSRTDFERASSTPNEIISLQYDRYENLLAAGIIPADGPQRVARPRPFPGSRDSALYVPDPPRY